MALPTFIINSVPDRRFRTHYSPFFDLFHSLLLQKSPHPSKVSCQLRASQAPSLRNLYASLHRNRSATVPQMTDHSLPEQQKALLDELTSLSEQQSKALGLAVFVGMSPEERATYDERAKRIHDICLLIKDSEAIAMARKESHH